MRTVDRQGVHIEQCENCRGIFLDHGELEQMLTAENRFYGASAVRAAGRSSREARLTAPVPRRPLRLAAPLPGGGHSDSPRPYGSRKHKSFLGDLFG